MATLYNPKSKVSGTKWGTVTGNIATAQELMVLPKDAIISGVYLYGAAVASSACTLTASVGADADGLLVAYDLAASGLGYNTPGATTGAAFGQKLTVDSTVTATLSAAVAGDAAKTWLIKVEYTMPGSGETLVS